MSFINDAGGPAFPSVEYHPVMGSRGDMGMTLRDYFAAKAMAAMLSISVKINQQAGPAAQSAAVGARNELTLRANAKLIAAAPDLLKACQNVVRAMEDTQIYEPEVAILRDAIKKATGEQA